MLPEWKDLRKKTRKLKIEKDSYFDLAQEYVELTSKFQTESILDTFSLMIDMVLYPLYILYQVCMMDFSPMYVMSVIKTYQIWTDWLRLRVLQEKVDSWTKIVRSVGGPWISVNDSDYHVYVYADGMERILYSKIKQVRQPSRQNQKTEKTSQVTQHPAQ
jgi:hypothetical protein